MGKKSSGSRAPRYSGTITDPSTPGWTQDVNPRTGAAQGNPQGTVVNQEGQAVWTPDPGSDVSGSGFSDWGYNPSGRYNYQDKVDNMYPQYRNNAPDMYNQGQGGGKNTQAPMQGMPPQQGGGKNSGMPAQDMRQREQAAGGKSSGMPQQQGGGYIGGKNSGAPKQRLAKNAAEAQATPTVDAATQASQAEVLKSDQNAPSGEDYWKRYRG